MPKQDFSSHPFQRKISEFCEALKQAEVGRIRQHPKLLTTVRPIDVWPRDQHRFAAWYNIRNEAYGKARCSEHFDISDKASTWLNGQTEKPQLTVEGTCRERLFQLQSKVR